MGDTNISDNSPVDLAKYLFTRLCQAGVRTVQGVPGQYNLRALDYIEPADLHWAGNANALNAGYAADGYARVKGISALVTSFGIGEFSALNAIAGSYVEKVPVVHVVGVPPTTAQQPGLQIHHAYRDDTFRRFNQMYREFTCAQATLDDPSTAPGEIDRVIRLCLRKSQPVYIELPTDMLKVKVSSKTLARSIRLPPSRDPPEHEAFVVGEVTRLLYGTLKPIIIVDALTARYDLASEAGKLIRFTGWPTYVTAAGKGCITETYSNFHGVFTNPAAGANADGDSEANDEATEYINSCDLLIRFGPLDTDSTIPIPTAKARLDLHSTRIQTTTTTLQTRNIKSILRAVLNSLKSPAFQYRLLLYPYPYPPLPKPRHRLAALPTLSPRAQIHQDTFWLRMSTFLRPGDVILTESGTASLGGKDLLLPPDASLLSSAGYLAPGYALGATVGAALAKEDMAIENKQKTGRTILFVGAGAFQMAAQAVSDVFRNRLNVLLFLVHNYGYATARQLHRSILGVDDDQDNGGWKGAACYTAVQPWDYLDAPRFFGAPRDDPEYSVLTRRVASWGELWGVLGDKRVVAGKGFCMIEVVMVREDVPGNGRGGAVIEGSWI
ncbi:thiamine diphosphate-binding protein [Aspergillus aurantiobrunneus]